MTRINLVEPAMLSDKHLTAEYKEITRPFTHAKKHLLAGRDPDHIKIPDNFTLGRGHETFFFNKIKWVVKRYGKLYEQMDIRGFNLNHMLYHEIFESTIETFMDTNWYNDWIPRPQDYYLSMSRLCVACKFPDVHEEFWRIFWESKNEA